MDLQKLYKDTFYRYNVSGLDNFLLEESRPLRNPWAFRCHDDHVQSPSLPANHGNEQQSSTSVQQHYPTNTTGGGAQDRAMTSPQDVANDGVASSAATPLPVTATQEDPKREPATPHNDALEDKHHALEQVVGLFSSQISSQFAPDIPFLPMPDPHGMPFYGTPSGLDLQNGNILQSLNNHPGNYLFSQLPVEDTAPKRTQQAFALLEFADSSFFMKTTAVRVGRNVALHNCDKKEYERLKKQRDESNFGEPGTPAPKRHRSKHAGSIASESGGLITGIGSDVHNGTSWQKAGKKSESTESDLHGGFVAPVNHQQPAMIQQVQPGSDDSEYDPNHCPLIGIHPPRSLPITDYPALLKEYNAISREHLEISFNGEEWQAIVLGRNGLFIDEEFRLQHDVVRLKSGSTIQIGAVVFSFTLPPEDGEQRGAELDTESGDDQKMDFEFEEPAGEMVVDDTSDSDDELLEDVPLNISREWGLGTPGISRSVEEAESEDSDTAGEQDEDAAHDDKVEIAEEQDGDDELDEEEGGEHERIATPKLQKKRGPGRPPKNGIMSKREQQEVAKKLAQKKDNKVDKVNTGRVEKSVSGKNKVGRPRKNSQEVTPPVIKEKRKYTKRKPKDDSAPKEVGSDGQPKPAKPKKEKKSRAALSPEPQFNEADFTPEQLARPAVSYIVLIHEVLSNSKNGEPMALSQIYRAMKLAYPYFALRAPTIGWQSSIRHNLQSHPAFTKVEREGKGFKWTIIPGVSIEKERKMKQLSPDPPGQHVQPIHQAGPPPHLLLGPQPGPGMMRPPPPYYGPGPAPGPYQHNPPPPGPYAGHLAQPQLVPPQSSSYSSPYGNPNPPRHPPQQHATNPSMHPPQQHTANPHMPPPQQHIANPRPATAPGPQYPQQPQLASQQPQNQPSARVLAALAYFRRTFIENSQGGTAAEATIVDSAINRVLGKSQAPTIPNSHENAIMAAVRNLLDRIPSEDVQIPSGNPPVQNRPSLRPSHPGQGPNRPSTTGAPRINSSGPANMVFQNPRTTASSSPTTLPSLSPAPQMPAHASPSPLSTGISTTNTTQTNGNGTQSVARNPVTPNPVAPNTASHIPVAPSPTASNIKNEPDDSVPNALGGGFLPPGVGQAAGFQRPRGGSEDNKDDKRPSVSRGSEPPSAVEAEISATIMGTEHPTVKRSNSMTTAPSLQR